MATNYDVDKMELQPSKLDGIIKRAKPIIANAKARMREAMDVVYEAYLEVGGQKGRSNTKTFSRACEEMGIHERQAYRLKNMKEVELGLRLPDPKETITDWTQLPASSFGSDNCQTQTLNLLEIGDDATPPPVTPSVSAPTPPSERSALSCETEYDRRPYYSSRKTTPDWVEVEKQAREAIEERENMDEAGETSDRGYTGPSIVRPKSWPVKVWTTTQPTPVQIQLGLLEEELRLLEDPSVWLAQYMVDAIKQRLIVLRRNKLGGNNV